MSISLREPMVVLNHSICDRAAILKDSSVRTMQDTADHEYADCPLLEPCLNGVLEARGIKCSAQLGQIMARAIIEESNSLEHELEDLRRAPIFPPQSTGFIDPYVNPELNKVDNVHIERKKETAIAMVEKWAKTILGLSSDDVMEKQPTKNLDIATLREMGETEWVFPGGIAKEVSRNKCRCPILNVGDHCPVHGG